MNPSEARRLAGSVLVVGFDGLHATPELCQAIAEGDIAGVILFRRNVASAQQVRRLATDLVARAPRAPVIAVDQEGGRVARLRAEVLQLPAMRALGARDDLALTHDCAKALGEELCALGINLDFAPVCDVDSNPANPVIGDRAFGPSPERVGAHATAFAQGLQEGGVLACAKHFPGHGDTETDSHFELPIVRHDRARLDAVELPPFRAAIAGGVATVMSAHVLFACVDPEVPATLSPKVMGDLLRRDLARDRDDLVIVSDDLLMKAVSARWPVEDSAPRAIAAGCDLLLICDDPDAQSRAREALASRAMSDADFASRLRDAARRVDALRARCPARPAHSDEALRAVLTRPARAEIEARVRPLREDREGRDPTAR